MGMNRFSLSLICRKNWFNVAAKPNGREAPAVDEDLKKKSIKPRPRKSRKHCRSKKSRNATQVWTKPRQRSLAKSVGKKQMSPVVAEIKPMWLRSKRRKCAGNWSRIRSALTEEHRPRFDHHLWKPGVAQDPWSVVFTRGETQALGVTTLGTREDEQMIDALPGLSYKNFMLHYNFPSFSVEKRDSKRPGRREIGHVP